MAIGIIVSPPMRQFIHLEPSGLFQSLPIDHVTQSYDGHTLAPFLAKSQKGAEHAKR